MRYKMFLFDKECVLDLKTDRIIFPFTKEYLDYQDWVTNNPNEFTRLVTKGKDDASWQGLLEEVIEKEDGTFVKKLYHDDYTLWVESESRLLPNQDYQTHGVQKTYHKDGWVKTEENFRSGLKHGRFYSYDVKGNITGIGKYSRDKKIGVWKYYFPLSKITQVEEVYYDGLWYFYYIDGTQEYEIKFDNGKAQDRLTYFGMDGQVKWEKTL